MALEDCEALALLLQHHLRADPSNGHRTAACHYCELRMPRVALVHKKAQETGALKQDMGFAKEMTMYFFILLISECGRYCIRLAKGQADPCKTALV